ncbi:FtsK/SpoIIIE domain-containing protein [Ornithinimicrobium avium]|uniref:FHA domain-containing protein n=1 Tax=Ornithinimicrobium avium TaxID=2283195 RepID=A0A345NIF3_9MICO|nr:FtsK/SpoIIIE domain-containing protein [Ornithinimicrobium avium]AXH94811.1 FHA domain-containing protein [Ornithinimicrobium avium]
MRSMVTVRHGGALRHVLLDASAAPTVGAAHEALGLPPPAGSRASEPLRHGYAVPEGPPAPAPLRPAARLVVVAGPDAGGSVELRPGTWVTVGRAATCDLVVGDPALSRVHLRLRLDRQGVLVEDLGSTNGLVWHGLPHGAGPQTGPVAVPGPAGEAAASWPPGAELHVGSSRLELVLEPLPPLDGHEVHGRVQVRPWPRPRGEAAPVGLETPTPPQEPVLRTPSAWSWALPLVASVAAAALLRMPMVLLFGLMAPAMVLGHHLGERRSSRRGLRQAVVAHGRALAQLEVDQERALHRDLRSLRDRDPGLLGVALAWHGGPTTALWSRGEEPPGVVVGEGALPSGVTLDGESLDHPAAPVTLRLDAPVALVGPPPLTAAAARSWLLQLATALPPSRLAIVVHPADPPGEEWDLLAWLPHTRPRPADAPSTNLVWGTDLLIRTRARDVPDGVPQVVVSTPGTGVLRQPGRPDLTFRPTLVPLQVARHVARGLAPLVEDRGEAERLRPETLGDLVRWPRDGDGVRAGWAGRTADLRVPLGTDEAGAPALVDLAADGPHALVAGTTGSGKSELLRTLVTALALRNRPSRLSLLLVDYKGGSSLAECAALPHCCGLVTDLDPHLAQRVLVSLTAELRRRETVLAAAGARDVREHPDLPRLVVVIDEFRVLAEELPEFLDGLVHLAAVGRSLGVHLVLATQRPAGVVSADLRANVNLRIALRVRDRADSLDVLEVPDAAELPEGRPGLALLRTGAAPPRRVQVVPAAPPPAPGRAPASGEVAEAVPGAWSGWCRLHAAPTTAESGLGDLPSLLSRVAEDDGERPLTVWRPPLPPNVGSDTEPGAWALADRPETQARERLVWDGSGHVAVVGAARTGRTTAVRSLLAATGPCWLYVVDLGRGLEGTEVVDHPGLRGWVGPHDPAHGLRVLERVAQVVDRRSGARQDGSSPVVLVVDGWDRLLEAYRDVAGGQVRDLLLRILRDGPGAGVVVLLTGGRSLLAGPVVAEVPEVWALHLHDPADLLLAGLRRHQVPSDQPPGRAVRTRDGLVAQVLLPASAAGPTSALSEPALTEAHSEPPLGPAPPRLESLPDTFAGGRAWSVGGDDASPMRPPAGSVLVLGPPGSGVSSTLATLAAWRTGTPPSRTASGSAPDATPPPVHVGADDAGPHGAERIESALRDHSGTVVVDDAHLLAGSRTEDLVLGWSARTGGDLLVGGELAACSGLFRGLVVEVARHRTGVVLQPDQPGQGAVLGVRLPVDGRRVPGRGVLVQRGGCTPIQVALPRPAGP